jgi:hypothetical protein
MSEGGIERRLVAILAADVVSDSRLMGEDEAGTLARLRTCRRELIDPENAKHKGRIVKTTGDGLLVEFSRVLGAVPCAVAFQGSMGERNSITPERERIVFRVGINVGDVIFLGSRHRWVISLTWCGVVASGRTDRPDGFGSGTKHIRQGRFPTGVVLPGIAVGGEWCGRSAAARARSRSTGDRQPDLRQAHDLNYQRPTAGRSRPGSTSRTVYQWHPAS